MILKRQFRDLQKHPVQGFSCGLVDESDFYEWEVLIIGPQDTVYEGAFLKARLSFPREYPLLPPKMQVCHALTQDGH
jgi:ubiquitin-conjugating enzyme E2 G1